MLQKLKTDILADGKIDADEVVQLRTAIYEDGKIDKEEADLLFALNDAVSVSGSFDPTFTTLFVEAISDYVLADEATPGVVDAIEAKYLVDQISGDGAMDENEQLLLKNIKAKATSIDSALDELYSLLPVEEVAAATEAAPVVAETEVTPVAETEVAPVAETPAPEAEA
jgi:uncharacterized tellurite resistance protein B-like protein